MKPSEWRAKLGATVREFLLSPEVDQFYSTKVTPQRAKLFILQLGLYVRHRRHYWPQVAANCPEMEVKRRILAHEYEELVEDEFSPAGHLELLFRHGNELNLSQKDILGAKPLPTTRGAVYGWWWIARNWPWQDALAASTTAEWINDDRLLGDIGGGVCTRLIRNWSRDLGFQPEQMPDFVAHTKADEKHSDMFLDIFERYVPQKAEQSLLDTASESMDLHRAFFGGIAAAMARLS